MIRKFLAILVLSAVTAFFPVQSKLVKQQQVNTYDTTHGIGGIEIQGEIDSHTAKVVHEAFTDFENNHIDKVVIHLNSPGGNVDAGADIVKDILDAEHDYNMSVSTYVDHHEYCASMCTGIFATGTFRVAAWDSVWLFHSPSFELTPEERNDPAVMKQLAPTQDASRKFLLNLYRLADPEWTDKVLKPHVMREDYPLQLTAVQIIDQSPWWFDYILEEDLAGK